MSIGEMSIGEMLNGAFGAPKSRVESPVEGPKIGRPRKPSIPRAIEDNGAIARVQSLFAPVQPVQVGKSGPQPNPNMDMTGAWGKPEK